MEEGAVTKVMLVCAENEMSPLHMALKQKDREKCRILLEAICEYETESLDCLAPLTDILTEMTYIFP